MLISAYKNYRLIRFLVFAGLILFTTSLMILLKSQINIDTYPYKVKENPNELDFVESEIYQNFKIDQNEGGMWRKLSSKQKNQLSEVGRYLFLDEPFPANENDNKIFQILFWKYGFSTHKRHIQRFTGIDQDPLEYCSVSNCRITYNNSELPIADLVIVHLHRTKSTKDLPPQEKRDPKQLWAFLSDENPHHTFLFSKDNKIENYNNVFNWSMTYRMDADIPVPYGRTILRKQINKDFNFFKWFFTKSQDVYIAILGSNCGSTNKRWQYVSELQQYIKVDRYGGCGTLKCPGHFNKDCDAIGNYIFYLSFENGNCDEYLTEKVFWNAFHKESIPIIMGYNKNDIEKLLPPDSYIHVENYATPRDLATYIMYLVNSPNELKQYFQWKQYFKILNEHGYFQTISYHYCRACEALNYNSKEIKVYTNLTQIWNKETHCYPAWNL